MINTVRRLSDFESRITEKAVSYEVQTWNNLAGCWERFDGSHQLHDAQGMLGRAKAVCPEGARVPRLVRTLTEQQHSVIG